MKQTKVETMTQLIAEEIFITMHVMYARNRNIQPITK